MDSEYDHSNPHSDFPRGIFFLYIIPYMYCIPCFSVDEDNQTEVSNPSENVSNVDEEESLEKERVKSLLWDDC